MSREETRPVSRRRLEALVRRFVRVRVLVVGDLMLDQFIWGSVQRISPEAPVPVVQVTAEDVRPGGAGNVVSNIAALGGRASACGIVGRDAAGTHLLDALRARGADVEAIVVSGSGATTQKTRIIAHQQQVVRLDREAASGPDGASARRVRDLVLSRRGHFDVLVVSDYAKGAVGPDLLDALAAARAREPFIWVVDPKRAHFAHYRRASLMKPNREEAAEAAGIEIRDRATLRAAGERLLARWETDAVLISRGEEGMTLFKRGGGVREFPTVAREVFDVTGAGDTVLATCALALGAGGTLEEASVLANHAAGVVVGKIGTATVSADELCAAIAAIPTPAPPRERTGSRKIPEVSGARLRRDPDDPSARMRASTHAGAARASVRRRGPGASEERSPAEPGEHRTGPRK